MVIELVLTFKDNQDTEDNTLDFTHTLNAPDDFEVTGGQIFVENPHTSELNRFSFRIDRAEDGTPKLTVLEKVGD